MIHACILTFTLNDLRPLSMHGTGTSLVFTNCISNNNILSAGGGKHDDLGNVLGRERFAPTACGKFTVSSFKS
jgi:hypothetical protein